MILVLTGMLQIDWLRHELNAYLCCLRVKGQIAICLSSRRLNEIKKIANCEKRF